MTSASKEAHGRIYLRNGLKFAKHAAAESRSFLRQAEESGGAHENGMVTGRITRVSKCDGKAPTENIRGARREAPGEHARLRVERDPRFCCPVGAWPHDATTAAAKRKINAAWAVRYPGMGALWRVRRLHRRAKMILIRHRQGTRSALPSPPWIMNVGRAAAGAPATALRLSSGQQSMRDHWRFRSARSLRIRQSNRTTLRILCRHTHVRRLQQFCQAESRSVTRRRFSTRSPTGSPAPRCRSSTCGIARCGRRR